MNNRIFRELLKKIISKYKLQITTSIKNAASNNTIIDTNKVAD
jgi:hypothetical protein